MTRYRNKRILKAARDAPCTLHGPTCNGDPATTVFAHLNESFAGKGMGIKADDCAGFFACSACHEFYDQHRFGGDYGWLLLRAYYRTIRRLLDEGILK